MKTMTDATETDHMSDYCMVFTEDLYDIVCLCHAALAQDSPETPYTYINAILGMAQGPLPRSYRDKVEEYLANKDYLPPVKIITNEMVVATKPNLITPDCDI